MSSIDQMQPLKQAELNIFKQFVKACEKLNLQYYLLGGTLLGAVRHKGFIPWDDDIDVGMFRKDYEVFCKNAQDLLPENYFIQTRETDPEYPYNFMKIRDSKTAFIETSIKKFNINHGIYIDVFPIDYYPTDKAAQKKLIRSKTILNYRMRGEFTIADEAKHSAVGELALSFLSGALRLAYPSVESVWKKREKIIKNTKQSELVANHCGAYKEKEVVPAEWFGSGLQIEFEGMQVTAPTEYDRYLTQLYGDYMQLPPEEQRVGHHFNEVIDVNKSYKEYISKQH